MWDCYFIRLKFVEPFQGGCVIFLCIEHEFIVCDIDVLFVQVFGDVYVFTKYVGCVPVVWMIIWLGKDGDFVSENVVATWAVNNLNDKYVKTLGIQVHLGHLAYDNVFDGFILRF